MPVLVQLCLTPMSKYFDHEVTINISGTDESSHEIMGADRDYELQCLYGIRLIEPRTLQTRTIYINAKCGPE